MNITGRRKQTGFTLIEIIIVVVILGILAAVALPKIIQNVGKSAAAEAFNIGGEFGKAFDRCLAEQTGGATVSAVEVALCDTFAEVNMTAPTSNNFTYTLATAGKVVTLLATAKVRNGLTTADTITFTYTGDTGAMTEVCSAGTLALMCKG